MALNTCVQLFTKNYNIEMSGNFFQFLEIKELAIQFIVVSNSLNSPTP